MKKKNVNYIDYAREVFAYFERNDFKTGEGGPYILLLDSKHDVESIRRAKFIKHTVKNLILTGYLEMKGMKFLCLTQKGYDFTQGGFLHCNQIELLQFVDMQRDQATQFNQLWEIIGNEKTALFYVSGPSYYKIASSLIQGLPYDYTTFVEQLDKDRQSRSVWYRELYLALNENQCPQFITALGEVIANEYEEFYPANQPEKDDLIDLSTPFDIENQQLENMKEEKKIKLFISHSSGDNKVVEEFVDLLLILGVNKPEQMFCSSCPPFDVKVNDDIFETIKDQYHNYRLFMIYMLSDNYYNSPVSLNEMGAGWVLQYDYQCITLPGFSPKNIKGCVNPSQKALVLDSNHLKADLNTFKDRISKIMKLETIDQNLWEMKRDRFVDAVTQQR